MGAWVKFWNRGGWWRAFALTAGYLAVFTGVSFLIVMPFKADVVAADKDILNSTPAFLGALLLPEIAGAAIITLFVLSVAWMPVIFARQSYRGGRWMWAAPVVIVAAAVARLFGTDWSLYAVSSVLLIFTLGLFVGYTEELVSRGAAVHLLRKGGYKERSVMVLSSLLFASMHVVSGIGKSITEIAILLVFAFLFGVAAYLTMVVTGSIVWAMVLHAITDPTTMLASGGVDAGHAPATPFSNAGTIAVVIYLVLFVVALFAIRGKVEKRNMS